MLIRFSVENFLSFKEKVEFSMVAGKTRQHPIHVTKTQQDLRLLRSAIIYGANAAGKSNLIKSIAFAKQLILLGTRPQKNIFLNQFKLDDETQKLPSEFSFEFKTSSKAYAYGFQVISKEIVSEWLYEIRKKTEVMLFERTNVEGKTLVKFGKVIFDSKKDEQFLDFVAQGTRPNQLFLTECTERSVEHFAAVYSWFRDKLTIIFPSSKFEGLELSISSGDELKTSLLELLRAFNTGITEINLKEIDIADITDLPEEVKENIVQTMEEYSTGILSSHDDMRYLLSKEEPNKPVKIQKLMTSHSCRNCVSDDEVLFNIDEESDGTQRLMDLLPALIDSYKNDKVYIIDELDRSLHPELSSKIMQLFLEGSITQDSQFIVTTHDASLLDLKLFRRDEIWFVEKSQNGSSGVYSLEEFAPRYDKDIRTGYLRGRFGAIPFVRDFDKGEWGLSASKA